MYTKTQKTAILLFYFQVFSLFWHIYVIYRYIVQSLFLQYRNIVVKHFGSSGILCTSFGLVRYYPVAFKLYDIIHSTQKKKQTHFLYITRKSLLYKHCNQHFAVSQSFNLSCQIHQCVGKTICCSGFFF